MIINSSRGRRWSGRTFARGVVVALSVVALVGALAPQPASAAPALIEVGSGFTQPLYVTHAGDSRLFVVEKGGRIKIIHPGGAVTTFLDISGRVSTNSERGLLGLAFHPDYATNRLFYVNYTRKDGKTVVAEMRRSAGDADKADPPATYHRRLMLINQPAANHNGGWMGFRGRLLFIALGDGGGDPKMRAQNLNTLLGKILRINPLDPPGSAAYTVPGRNPYVGRTGRDEIWASGLRNPWRCSFDFVAGRLWCADVGQNKWEEINRAPAKRGGLNYGWPVMEGRHCFNPPTGCNTSGKKLPIAEYEHAAGRCSVTGGYVSRRAGSSFYGQYIFGEFCTGEIWTIPANHQSGASLPAPWIDTSLMISSFGEGHDGRIYVVDYSGGRVLLINNT